VTLPKLSEIQHNSEVAIIQLQKSQQQSNRIKIREIKPTKEHTSKKLPKLMFVFDTEADIEDLENGIQRQTFRVGYGLFTRFYPNGRQYESDYRRFTDAEQFYDLLEAYSKQGSKLYCFAHNIGYDWSITGIHKTLIGHDWGTNTIADRKGNTVIKYTKGAHTILMIDTLNFFKMPLSALATAFNLEKGSVDFRHVKEKSLEDYCKNDVYILNEVMRKWRNVLLENNFGAFKPTIASQALAIFKQLYLNEPIKTNQGLNQKQLERQAYYGGRTEAAFIGNYQGKIWNLDINSAYPSVMRDNKFPVEFVKECLKPKIEDVTNLDNKHCCFAEVEIDTRKPYYPKHENDRLLFPVGRFVTWLCEPELKVAIENKHVRRIKRLFVYKARLLFKDYVTELYRKRRAAIENQNPALALIYKYLLNSLYGKFGEYRKEWQPKRENGGHADGSEYVGDIESLTVKKVIHFGGLEYEYVKKEGATHSFPLISAFVTSYLRVKMLQAMQIAGNRNWIYCDSDSLYVTDLGKHNLDPFISDSKLGYWKIEKIGINMVIRGLKDYLFAGEEKLKGVPKDSKQLDKNTYEIMQWQSMHKTICENKYGSVEIVPMIKKMERVYNKGFVNAEGWVYPIVIEEFT